MEPVVIAFALTLFAGLSTGIGSCIAFFTRRTNTKFLSYILGFSAGIMIYLSFVEILPEAASHLTALDPVSGPWLAILAFFAGILIVALIDKLIPSIENPHEVRWVEEMESCPIRPKQLMRLGLGIAIVIAVHNFPEGIATFAGAMQDLKIGISVAIAIAIHNIPEGIVVSVPVYCATGSRKKAFMWSFASGLSEPLGALIGFFALRWLLDSMMLGMLLAAVAGIMVFISLDQLLPTARQYGEHHLSIYGLLTGMLVMAVSIVLFF